jgi:hypothetical protein
MPLPPQGVGDQRDAITMALMGINNPPGKRPLQGLPQNLSGGMSAIGNAIGGMGQPPPGPPASLAPPAPGPGMPQPPPMQPPMAPPAPGAPPPQGAPVGQMPPMPPQGPQGLY